MKSSAPSFSLRAALAAVALVLAPAACAKENPPAAAKSAGQESAVTAAPASPNLTTAIIQVAKDTIPAVVHIEVTERREVKNPLYSFGSNPFFQRFFGLPKHMPRKFKQELRALGTGMLMDTQGHILTNAHVVAGATQIQVQLADGEQYSGSVVGIDEKTDLAVVKIPAKETLPNVTFGDSDKVVVGQWVVAIGHPRGLSQTVTQGIISAKHRTGIKNPSSYEDFLQTDAPINPGNSGGPLITLAGQVIGVNSMIASTSGGSQGLGFAIPSNMATNIAGQLIANGKVVRGWLGVSIQEITPALAKSLGLTSTQGALVADVVPGGPAADAGMKRGDVVVAFNGQPVPNPAMLRDMTASATVGQEVPVEVLRKGEKVELKVKIGNLEEATQKLMASIRDRLGVMVRAITPQESNHYGLEPNTGVVITSVEPNGPLGEKGFEVDDVILEIAGQALHGPEEFASVVQGLQPGKEVVVLGLDHRTGNTGYVRVTVK